MSVPADQLDKTRLTLAGEGMPQTGRLGFEIFDKPNWAGSDFSEQVNYQRALEGELERTIQTLGNVRSVRIHLVLPHDSLFSDRERLAKAAVVMKLRSGGLSDEETNAVTHLVASAVDNLSPENVTLIGADGRTPLVAKGHNGTKGMDASVELETALAEKLVMTLAPVVGPDHVKASVTVAYDRSSGDSTQEIYDPRTRRSSVRRCRRRNLEAYRLRGSRERPAMYRQPHRTPEVRRSGSRTWRRSKRQGWRRAAKPAESHRVNFL